MEEREEQFLDAARALIAEHGLLKLQMTRIAEKCEYAVGTLYQHFASKEDLLLALTVQDSREHVELFQRVGRWAASPRERMFAIGVADLVFVKRNPEHFRLKQYVLTEAVWDATSPERRKDYLDAHAPIGDVVGGISRGKARTKTRQTGLGPASYRSSAVPFRTAAASCGSNTFSAAAATSAPSISIRQSNCPTPLSD